MDIKQEVELVGGVFRTKFHMINSDGVTIATSMATDMPGLCDHVYFHDTWMMDEYRGKGLGNEFEAYRVNYFDRCHIYSVIMASNTVQRHLAVKYGFTLMSEIDDPYLGPMLWYVRRPSVNTQL